MFCGYEISCDEIKSILWLSFLCELAPANLPFWPFLSRHHICDSNINFKELPDLFCVRVWPHWMVTYAVLRCERRRCRHRHHQHVLTRKFRWGLIYNVCIVCEETRRRVSSFKLYGFENRMNIRFHIPLSAAHMLHSRNIHTLYLMQKQ